MGGLQLTSKGLTLLPVAVKVERDVVSTSFWDGVGREFKQREAMGVRKLRKKRRGNGGD